MTTSWLPAAPASTSTAIVGFVGVGFMGCGMVANLTRAGFRVHAFNRTPAKVEELRLLLAQEDPALADRVYVARSPAEVIAATDQVHLCLASEEATTATLSGEGGLLTDPSRLRGALVLDHGTVSPSFSAETHAVLRDCGAGFLDAPISGGPEGARHGTMSIMVGGEATHFQRAKPALDAMGGYVVHLGQAGAGCAAKLVNQTLVAAHAMAAAEAIALAESMGVERLDVLMELLSKSFGNSVVLQRCGAQYQQARAADSWPGPGPLLQSQAPLRLITKDLRFILRRDRSACSPKLRLAEEALAMFEALCQAGQGEADFALVAWKLQQDAKTGAGGDGDATAATAEGSGPHAAASAE